MITINGKIVDFTNKDPKYRFAGVVDEYHKTIKQFKETHGTGVLFQTPAHKARIDPVTKIARPYKPFSWPYKTTVVTDDGTQDWVYSKSAPTIKDGIATPNEPSFIIPRGEIYVSLDEDPDKVYFLTKIRAFNRKPPRLWVYNPAVEEESIATKRANESKINDLIYSEHSPLSVDLEKLKMIASKWGVANVDKKTTAGIKNALYDAVMSGEANRKRHKADARGVEDFVADIGGSDAVRVGAIAQNAIDAGVLTYNRSNGRWMLTVAKGQQPIVIMTAGSVGGDEARSRLIDYLVKSKADTDLIDKAAKGEAKVEHGRIKDVEPGEEIILPEDVDLDNIDSVDGSGKHVVTHQMLQKAGKALAVNTFGMKTEDMRAAVREKLEQLAQTT